MDQRSLILEPFYPHVAFRLYAVHLTIVLVVILCNPELAGRGNFCNNIIPFPFQYPYDSLCTLLFRGSLIEYLRPVLRTFIHTLAVELCRVMNLHKQFEKCLITYCLWIVSYLHSLCMACCTALYLLVCGVFNMATHISGNNLLNPFLLLQQMFCPPEASSCKICLFLNNITKIVKNGKRSRSPT